MIKLVLDSVRRSMEHENHFILMLKQEDSERYLPLWVGPYEADMILAKLTVRKVKQPATYDYFRRFLLNSDLDPRYVYIHSVLNDIYYAMVVAARRKLLAEQAVEIDCRPSDGILLALYFSLPIYASPELMNKHSIPKPEEAPSPIPFDPYHDFWQNFIDLD
jgi:bifunctional DNase/RNase